MEKNRELFSAKNLETFGQLLNDREVMQTNETDGNKSITPEKALAIITLVDKYKKTSIEKTDVIISVETSFNFGNIKIISVSENHKPEEFLSYKEGSSDYVRVTTLREKTILFTDFSDTQPFNRQGGLYVPHRWERMSLVKTTPLYREFECNSEFSGGCSSFHVNGFKYNEYWKSVTFGICVIEKDANTFISEFRALINK